jgi:hypothetical protein
VKPDEGRNMLDRREFLKVSAVGGLVLSLPMDLLAEVVRVEDPLQSYPDRSWEDVYRKEFLVPLESENQAGGRGPRHPRQQARHASPARDRSGRGRSAAS